MEKILGLRIDGVEGSNEMLPTWRDKLGYLALLLIMGLLAWRSQ